MHGIQKLEESARRAREAKRQKKVVEIDAARKAIFALYANFHGHERKLLDATGEILSRMPDVYTFWVIRRDVLEHVRQRMSSEEGFTIFSAEEIERHAKKLQKQTGEKLPADDVGAQNAEEVGAPEDAKKIDDESQSAEKAPEEQEKVVDSPAGDAEAQKPAETPQKHSLPLPTFDDVLNVEITLTETALLANHKSYSAWNHRKWAFNQHSNPPLARELEICQKALNVDWRNFHVWDYRRFVVRKLERSEEEEFEFADSMVKRNPSNYSAWHYRVNLMGDARENISDETFVSEVEKITDVCVVNSEDQTAWTYVNWLIANFVTSTPVLGGVYNLISFVDHPTLPDGRQHSSAVFEHAVSAAELRELFSWSKDVSVEILPRGRVSQYTACSAAHVWDLYSAAPLVVPVLEAAVESGVLTARRSQTLGSRRVVNTQLLGELLSVEAAGVSLEVANCLRTFIDVCTELARENEEGNPWELSTKASLLPLVAGIDDNIHGQVISLLEKATACDSQREALYASLADAVRAKLALYKMRNFVDSLVRGEVTVRMDLTDYTVLRPLAGLILLDASGVPETHPQLSLFKHVRYV